MNSWCHCTVLRADIQRLDHTMYPPGTEEVPMLAEEPQVICLTGSVLGLREDMNWAKSISARDEHE